MTHLPPTTLLATHTIPITNWGGIIHLRYSSALRYIAKKNDILLIDWQHLVSDASLHNYLRDEHHPTPALCASLGFFMVRIANKFQHEIEACDNWWPSSHPLPSSFFISYSPSIFSTNFLVLFQVTYFLLSSFLLIYFYFYNPYSYGLSSHALKHISIPVLSCVLFCAVLCCAILCCAMLCCAMLCYAMLCCAMLFCAALRCAVLCRAVPLCTVLHCAVLCCAMLCCAISFCAISFSRIMNCRFNPNGNWSPINCFWFFEFLI